MSLLSLRRLPSLRTPLAHRTCVYAFSSSASCRSTDANEAMAFFDDLAATHGTPAPAPSKTKASVADDAEPPAAPDGSYPRAPSLPNPLLTNPVEKVGPSKRGSGDPSRPLYAVSVKATRNNTIITFARDGGEQLVTLTGGKLGFKKSNRNGYEAGYQCAVGIIGAMEKELMVRDYEWQLYLNGFGQGRDAMLTAITTAVGENMRQRLRLITDRTPLKIGGTRGKKTRRV